MSQEIKTTIAILCKLANRLFDTELKAEHFRLAKHNKTDENVVPLLWNTIKNLLEADNVCDIREKLQSMGYTRKEFYSLCIERNNGSRELLLVVVFILAQRINEEICKLIGKEHAPSFLVEQSNQNAFNWERLTEKERKHYETWITGKTQSNNRLISEFEEQIEKIQDKYNKILNMKAHSKLTVYEILGLKSRRFEQDYLCDTEPIVGFINIYSEWNKKEKIFWKWMITVLEEANKP